MRYMMIIKNTPDAVDALPSPEGFSQMVAYNQSLLDAGVLRAVDGLTSMRTGKQITFTKGRSVVKDGPFSEAKEIIGGFWIIEVKSETEALEWAQRMPCGEGTTVEVRRVAEISDFKGLMTEETAVDAQAIRDRLAGVGT